MRVPILGWFALSLTLGVTAGEAKVIHVAPQSGSSEVAPDGSAARPYPSVSAAFSAKAVVAGDSVQLATGDYGLVGVYSQAFLSPVDIGPAPNAKVHVERIDIRASRNLRFHDLGVWPTTPLPKKTNLVAVDTASQEISFTNMEVRGIADPGSFPTWTKQEWLDRAVNGFFLGGAKSTLRNSTATGIHFGAQVIGADSVVEGNLIDGFSADGLRGLGDRSVFRRNTVRNCVQVDGNHADGFQSWSVGTDKKPGRGTVTGLVIDSNKFLEWTNPVVSPMRCELQGVALFDGMFKDVVIQNNLIAVSAYHGIAVYGGINARILNNTVVDPIGTPGKRPWIRIGAHKDGRPSQGGVIANNMAMQFTIKVDPAKPILNSKNLVIAAPLRVLESPQTGDYRPRRDGSAIDSADVKLAPRADLTGVARPNPSRPDLGAIERR